MKSSKILGARFSFLLLFAVGAPVQAADPPDNFYLSNT